jgi:hypothetical protein
MTVRGDKLGARPTDRSADVLRIVSGALFLRSSRVHPTLLGHYKMLPRMGTARRKRISGIRGLVRKAYVSCVSGYPCRLYINSNRRDSWI